MKDSDTIALILRLAGSVGVAIGEALEGGDISSLDALRQVLKKPEDLKALDDLLIVQQQRKAEAALR